MIEESFKVGLQFELEQDSLDKIVADVKKKIQGAIKEASAGAGRAAPPIPGGTATAKSIKQTVDIDASDVARQIREGIASELAGFGNKLDKVTQALTALDATLARIKQARATIAQSQAAAPQAAPVASKPVEVVPESNQREMAKAVDNLVDATNKEAAAREEAAKRVRAATPPGGGSSVSGPPATNRDPQRMAEARGRVSDIQKGAAARVEGVNASLKDLTSAILNIPAFKGMNRKELMGKLNLPGEAEVGPGAAPQLKDFSGQVKVVGGVVEMLGADLIKLDNVVSERIRDLMAAGGTLDEIRRTARRDPERAMSRLRKEISGVTDLATVEEKGRPRKHFQKGGEVILRYTPTEAEKERLSALKNEADVIGELNKIIYQHIAANEALRNSLREMGIERIMSPGLTETKASEINVLRGESESGKGKGPIERVDIPMQTRNLSTMGLGGGGGLARWTREFLTTQIADVRGGGSPSIKGFGEQALEEAGMILKAGFKEFVTVLADPDLIPELREDQFLFDPKVVDMAMDEIKSIVLKDVAAGIAPGTKLAQGQILGTRGIGDNAKQVQFEMTGVEAEIERLEQVFVDGVEGVRIVYKELNNTVSGMKFVDRSGVKGIGRAADLEKMGFAAGTGMVMSLEGLVKRHGLRTGTEMMSHSLAEKSGRDPQEVADAIVTAMEEGGKTFKQAVKEVAGMLGVKNFTGTMKVGGKLAEAAGGNLEVLAGKMAWARAPREGMTGGLKTEDRYIDPAAMAALRSRAETAGLAEQWKRNMEVATKANEELFESLKSMVGETDIAALALRKMLPEDIKRLPAGGAGPDDFKGTLLDPDLAQAFTLSLPGREGKERLMRVPSISDSLGGRGSYESSVGTSMPNKVATQLDRIMEQAAKVRGITGKTPMTAGSEAMEEVAEVTSRAIENQIDAISKMGIKTEEGAEAANAFVKKFMPIISMLQGPVNLKWRRLNDQGQPVGRTMNNEKGAQEYVEGQSGIQKLLAIRDILAVRRPSVSTSKDGRKTVSIEQQGKIHSDLELLTKVMKAMGIELNETSEAAEKAMARLEGLEEGLLDIYAESATSRAKPSQVSLRSLAATAEAGSSLAPMGTALQFRTDVSQELTEVSKILGQMAAEGKDVGEALGAFQRITAAQEVDLPAISRDTVLINQKDFQNLVEIFAKELKISQSEAKARLQRTGMAQRYPITGEQSFMAAKLRPVGDDVLPQGKFGVSGTMAVSSKEDLAKMLGPLEQLEAELIQTAESNKYEGEAAAAAGRQLAALAPLLGKLRLQFVATALNLDFDGDKIAFHADMARDAASGLRTFNQEITTGGASFRKALTTVLAQSGGPGGPGTSMEDLERMFQMGKAKGRTGEFKAAVPWRDGPERAEFESVAHTAPKKSVGLLTDTLNKMFLAVHSGGEKMSNAMNTTMGQMMLGMNEALSQKHGTKMGADTGPMAFVEQLRKGQLTQIFAAMDEGQGFFGKLAEKNKQMLKVMETDLRRIAATKGAEGLMDVISREGLDVQVDPKNMAGAIADILKAADIKTVILQMFEGLKRSAIAAAREGGETLAQATELVEDSLRPSGKKGFIKGLDFDKLLYRQTPGYGLTRGKAQKSLEEMSPMERAQATLAELPQKLAQAGVGDVDLSDAIDPKDVAKSISTKLNQWIIKVLGDTSNNISYLTQDEMKARTGRNAKGAFVRGKETEEGTEGPILIRKDIGMAFYEAKKALDAVGQGAETDAPKILAMADALEQFLSLLSHESLHRANKAYSGSVQDLAQVLATGQGEVGEFRDTILQTFSGIMPKIESQVKAIGDLVKRRDAGETQAEVTERQALPSGGFGAVKNVKPIAEAISILQTQLATNLAEEILAYGVQGSGTGRGRDAFEKLPEAVQQYVGRLIERVKSQSGAGGNLLRAVTDIRSEILPAITGSLMNAASGKKIPDAAKGLSQVAQGLEPLADFPDAGRFNRALEILGAHERAIIESGGIHPSLSKIAQGPKGLDRTSGPSRGTSLGSRPEFKEIDAEIKAINEAILTSVPSPEELVEFERRIKKAAQATRSKISALSKDPTVNREMGGIKPQEEYTNIIREYQRNLSFALSKKARQLQDDISAMRNARLEQTPEFAGLVQELLDTVARIQNHASSTLSVIGKGRGTVASYLASAKGELIPSAQEAGVAPGPDTFESVVQSVGGYGEEGESFVKRLKPAIYSVLDALQSGEDELVTWGRLFEVMSQYPDTFKVDLNKMVEILSKFSRLLGTTNGQFGELSTSVMQVANNAKEIGKAIKNVPVNEMQDVLGATTRGTKAQKKAGAAATGLDTQMQSIMAEAEAYRGRLKELIKTPGYEKMGGGRRFEGKKFDLIDPKTGDVLQKFGAEFVRRGDDVVMTFKQIGEASKSAGNMISTAFRRVVQWGFASGIVYGTMRAFRELTAVIVEVETKVTELKKVMDSSTTNFQALQDVASDMGREFGISIQEVLEGMSVYGQQGLKMKEVTERTRATLLAVNTTTLDTKEATEALTAVMKIFNDEVGSSEGAVDAWAAVAAKHAVTAEDLAFAVQRSGAAAKAAGVSFNDFLGITTAIGSVTRQSGKEVATATKFMFQSMRRPEAQKQLLGIGVKSEDMAGNLRPAMDILGDLKSRWEGLSNAQRLNIAQALAGIRHYNQFLVLMDNWQEVLDASSNAQDSQGFAVRKNAIAMQTFNKQLTVLQEAVKRVALDLGKFMLPAMKLVVSAADKIIGTFNLLPDVIKAAAVAGAGGFLVLHKGADLLLDTMDLLGGTDITEGVRGAGIFATLKDIPNKIKGSFKGIGSVLKGGAAATAGFEVLDSAGNAIKTGEKAAELGFVSQGLMSLSKAAGAAKVAWQGLNLAMKASIIGAVVAGVVAVTVALMNMKKSGKEAEDEMADRIGRVQDEIDTLGKEEKSLRRVSTAWDKYASSVKTAADPEKLKTALAEGTFKGPLVALKEYQDTIAETGTALAGFDPSSIEGISETGDYIFTASDAMGALADSAIDAKKATMAAMQTSVIKAYTDDLTTARNFMDYLKEGLSFGLAETGMLKDLTDAREKVQSIADVVQSYNESGLTVSLALQKEMNDAVAQELSLRGDVALAAQSVKQQLEALPSFGNLELAQSVVGSGKIREATDVAAAGGAYGRDATGESVRLRLLSKSLGLGGVIGAESSANADRMMQDMLGRGLSFRKGGPSKSGEVTALPAEAAEELLKVFAQTIQRDPNLSKAAIERARTVLTGMNDITGEMIFFFEAGLEGVDGALSESDIPEKLRASVKELLNTGFTLDRGSLEAAAERTRRILTVQAKGALAGIRIPKEGMPDLGPAKFRDLSIEQRVLGTLPDDMQRLAEVQKELATAQDRYNESLSEAEGITELAAAGINKELRTFTQRERELIQTLKFEEFELSALGLVVTELKKLDKVLEDVATASRDAAIEEKTRFQLMKNTSGALKGLPVVQELDFGKSLRELSGQERLQKQLGPGFSAALARITSTRGQVERGVSTTVDLRKQMADVKEMIANLNTARGNLNEALLGDKERAKAQEEATGVTPDGQAVERAVQEQGQAMLAELVEQTPVMNSMLDFLEVIAEASVGNDKSRKSAEEKLTAIKEGLKKTKSEDLLKLIGTTSKQRGLRGFETDVLGLRRRGAEESGSGTFVRTKSPVQFQSEESAARFESLISKLMAAQDRLALVESNTGAIGSPDSGPSGAKSNTFAKEIQSILTEITAIPEVGQYTKEFVALLASREKKTKTEVELEKSATRQQETLAQLRKREAELLGRLTSAEQRNVAEVKRATQILQENEDKIRIAAAVQDFANSIEQTIQDFKKAEMLAYTKVGSDLEGDFARVGQPGFRTQFENRRKELDKQQAKSPIYSVEDYNSREEARKQIDFDEAEAKIKQKQEVETAQLRQQQSMAEQLRNNIADALMGGQLAGSPETESLAKSYLETLTSQLSESEQAEQRGGELVFKGIPALDDASRFLRRISEIAEQQAQQAQSSILRSDIQAATSPMVTEQQTTNQILGQMLSASQQAATAGAGAGIPGIGGGAAVPVGPGAPGASAAGAPEDWYHSLSKMDQARMLRLPSMLPGEKQFDLKNNEMTQGLVAFASNSLDGGATDLTDALSSLEDPEGFAWMDAENERRRKAASSAQAALQAERDRQAAPGWAEQQDQARAQLQFSTGAPFKMFNSQLDPSDIEANAAMRDLSSMGAFGEIADVASYDQQIAEVQAKMDAILAERRAGPGLANPMTRDLAMLEGLGAKDQFESLAAQKKDLMAKREGLVGQAAGQESFFGTVGQAPKGWPSAQEGREELKTAISQGWAAVVESFAQGFNGPPKGLGGGGFSMDDVMALEATLPQAQAEFAAVGPSNSNRAVESAIRSQTGNANRTAVPSTFITEDIERGLPTAGTAAERAQKEDLSGGSPASAQAETNQQVAENVARLVEVVAPLAETGFTVPESLTSSIDGVGSAVADRLGEVLSVSVTNTPLEVNVAGLAESLSAAFKVSGIESIGAGVSQALGRIAVLETVADPEAIEARIQKAADTLTDTIDQLKTEQQGQLDSLAEKVGSLPDMEELETKLTEGLETVGELSPKVDKLSEDLTKLKTEFARTSQALRDSLNSLRDDVTKNKTDGDRADQVLTRDLGTANSQINEIKSTLSALKGKTESALSKAEQALNKK